MKNLFVAATAALTMLGVGHAAPVTVNLMNLHVNSHGIAHIDNVVTEHGTLDFLISGVIYKDGEWQLSDDMSSGSPGVWLQRNKNDNHQVDGKGKDEGIVIQAQTADNSEVVHIDFTSFTFTYVTKEDDFGIYAAEDSFGDLAFVESPIDIPGTSSPNMSSPVTADYLVESVSTVVVAALEKNDDWKLKSFTFEWKKDDPMDPVPVPGALPLMVAGLGALGLARKKRRA